MLANSHTGQKSKQIMEATGKYVMRYVVKSEERTREAVWNKGWLLKHKAEMRRFVCGSQGTTLLGRHGLSRTNVTHMADLPRLQWRLRTNHCATLLDYSWTTYSQ